MKGIKDVFMKDSVSTVGFEFLTFTVKLNNKIIRLQIWDTCGQEIYKSLVSSFYRNTSLAILVYSIDNRNTFNDIDTWLKELRTHANPDVKLFLIGSKCDLEDK
jgi:Ras-related protein Rab-11A